MNPVLKADLKFGLEAEKIIKTHLEKSFNKLTKTEDQHHNFDFYNKECYVEFKRRRINFGQYPDLMFELCKINKGLELIKEGYRVFFVWGCNDGCYYWELLEEDKEYFKAIGGRSDRGRDEYKVLAHIKNCFIKPLPNSVLL
jgi:hypothetical protein